MTDRFEALRAATTGQSSQNDSDARFNALRAAVRNPAQDTGQATNANPESPQATIEGIPLPPQRSPIDVSGWRQRTPANVEFPDAGEITDIEGLGFGESIRATLATGMTEDAAGKAQILAQQFGDDSRFGGVFQDSYGNPLIQWEGQPYYINVPGLSGTDLNDFLGALVSFLPASRFVGAATSAIGRGAVALPAYAATEAGRQLTAQELGSGEDLSIKDMGVTAGIGATTEALMPPLMRGASRALRGAFGQGTRQAPNAAPYRSGQIPLTSGQASSDLAQIQAEEAMRNGARGEAAQTMMRTFDQRQNEAIGTVANTLEERLGFGVGVGPQSATNIGARLQDDLISARTTAHRTASDAMTNAASQRNAASFTPDSFRDAVRGIKDLLRSRHFDLGAPGMESVRHIVQQAETFANIPGLRSVNMEAFETLRGRVSNLIQNNGTPADTALKTINRQLDTWLDDAVTNGLINGDEAVISQLREARGLWRHYRQMFTNQGDATGRLMEKLVDERQATPVNFVSALVSLTRANRQATARSLINRLGDIFGRDSQQFQLVRSAYLTEAFTRPAQGAREVTGRTIQTNLNFLLDGDGAVLARELFSPDEISLLRTFRDDVARTVTPAEAMNPSRSGWASLRELVNRGILPSMGTGIGRAAGYLPGLEAIAGAARNRAGAMAASDAIAGMNALHMPLANAGAASIGQQAYQNPERIEAFLAPLQRPQGLLSFDPPQGLLGVQ